MKPVVATLLAAFLPLTLPAAEKPNIILIMADDVGYGDISAYGSASFKTPNIDKLAKEGQRFTSGYCSASTCTPSRFSLLTGVYAFRQKGTGIAPPNGPLIIDEDTFTLPDMLKEAGYKTAVIGKWHLGLGDPKPDWNGELKPGPLEIGFDQAFLLPTTNDRVPQVYVKDHRVHNLDPKDPLWVGKKKPSPDHPTGKTHRDTLKMDWTHGHNGTIHNGISRIGFYTGGHAARFRDEDLGDKWVEQSKIFIEENKDEPFFLFFASHDNHVPRTPHERFHGKSGTGFRGDAIIELDWCVGELMKEVEKQGISEKTMIIFCSDNGPVLDDGYADGAVTELGDHNPSGPFSGGKYSVLEGGTRTPFITWWPGTIQPGVSDQIVCTIDFAASFSALVSGKVPDGAYRDSENILSALLGKEDAKGRKALVQQDNGNKGPNGAFGLRVGDWKLLRNSKPKGWGAKVTVKPFPSFDKKHTLHFLPDDPSESKDLSEEKPEKTAEMIAILDKILGESPVD
ncbi:MAG: arylsulfatase [Akkermansiaceae bacterium]